MSRDDAFIPKRGRKTFRAGTMIELKDAIYRYNGWVHKLGDNKSQRLKDAYDVTVDHQRGQLVAKLKETTR